jgi:hypothetical protein
MKHTTLFLFAAIVTATACGSEPTVEPEVPLCTDLGCETALCNRAGACTCTPNLGETPIACRGALPPDSTPDASPSLATCPELGCPGSATIRRLTPVCQATGCACGATGTFVACLPTCEQLGCAAGGAGTCDATGFTLACAP